jgi:hypothetical protein
MYILKEIIGIKEHFLQEGTYSRTVAYNGYSPMLFVWFYTSHNSNILEFFWKMAMYWVLYNTLFFTG